MKDCAAREVAFDPSGEIREIRLFGHDRIRIDTGGDIEQASINGTAVEPADASTRIKATSVGIAIDSILFAGKIIQTES